MKGSKIILLLVLFVVIAGAAAFLYFNKKNKQYPPACLALPPSAVFAYQGTNLNEDFTDFTKTGVYTFLRKNPAVSTFENDYRFFDSVMNNNSFMLKSLAATQLVVSLNVTSADNYQLLFLHQTKNDFDTHDIEKLVKGFDPDERALDHNFDNVTVTEILNSQKQPLFSYAFIDGIIALSRNSGLVEEAISAYNSNESNPSDIVNQMVAEGSQKKLYINYAHLPDLINVYASQDLQDKISTLGNFASFGDYDWKAENNLIRLSGSVETGAKPSLISGLQNQTPKEIGIPDILPPETSMFMDWCADSFSACFANHKAYLAANGLMSNWENAIKKTTIGTGIDPIKDILPLIGTEWGYAMLESSEGNIPDKLFMIKATDSASSSQSLKKITNVPGQTSEYNGYQINQFRGGNTFGLLFGDMFNDLQTLYFSKVGDYLVFAQNTLALQKCIDAYKGNKTLKNEPDYMSFSKSLVSKSNFFLYINPELASDYGAGYAKREYQDKYKANMATYKGFNGFAFQLAANGKDFYSQITLAKPSDKEGTVETAWATVLDAGLLGKPHIVTNYETGTNEVMVQDSSNKLYLISNSGNILWKRQLNEPVEGDIYTMDMFQNEQPEYLFATTDKLYLIDHSGKDAGSYPLNLAGTTHAGLSMFDFDNNKEYTYFVCCDHGEIYGYHGDGKPLAGWLPKNVDGTFSSPIQYVYYNGKQDLYGVSQKGTFYLWDIYGNQITSPTRLYSGFKNPFSVSLDSKSFVSADTSGRVFMVSFAGAVKKKAFPDFKDNPFFGHIDKDENGKAKFVLSSGKTIGGFGSDSAEKWKLVTSDKIVYPPHVVYFNDKPFIGYVEVPTAKVYLFTPLGVSYPGFPVIGNTDFFVGDLSGSGGTDIIIGGPDKKIYHYRLND